MPIPVTISSFDPGRRRADEGVKVLDLSYGKKYDRFRAELRGFIEEKGHLAPAEGEQDLGQAGQ